MIMLDNVKLVEKEVGGTLVSVLECLSCKHRSPSSEKFSCLVLDIPSQPEGGAPVDLRTCFKESWKTEFVKDGKCSSCGFAGANKSFQIESMPSILIVQVKRFELTEGGYIKNQTLVKIPQYFELEQEQYNVIGIVNHVGDSMDSGHYTANVKLGNWKLCNDRRIQNIGTMQVNSSEVYLVFCTRKVPNEKT